MARKLKERKLPVQQLSILGAWPMVCQLSIHLHTFASIPRLRASKMQRVTLSCETFMLLIVRSAMSLRRAHRRHLGVSILTRNGAVIPDSTK